MGHIHSSHLTPSTAVVAVGIASGFAVFLGQAGLVPILEVGAVAVAVGWMAACASYYRMKPALPGRVAAIFGVLVTGLMISVKVLPGVPGHFSSYEWMALAAWVGLGLLIKLRASYSRTGQFHQEVVSPAATDVQQS
jgi:hypothetical protein